MESPRKIISIPATPELEAQIVKRAKALGMTKAAFVRAAVVDKLGAAPASQVMPSTPEKTRRTTFYLQPSERLAFVTYAKSRGYSSWQDLALNLLRSEVYGRPMISPAALTALADNNFQLSAVGKNLNQIAHAINSAALEGLGPGDVAKLDQVLELATHIKSHLKMSVDALASTTRRFR